MDIGTKILEHRKKAGLSQEELGFKLNVSRQSVSLWETNQVQPTLDKLISLSKIFNVSVDEFLDNEDNKKEVLDKTNQSLFSASMVYTKEVYEKAYKVFFKKQFILNGLGIASAIILIVCLLCNNFRNIYIGVIISFIIGIAFFISNIIRIIKNIKKNVIDELKIKPNLKSKYYFYDEHFDIESTSDNTNSNYSIKYSEITFKKYDSKNIYLIFEGMHCVIDISTCEENFDKLLKLLNIKKKEKRSNIRKLLLIFFILSILSIYIGLFLIMLFMKNSPNSYLHNDMIAYMWCLYLVIPIPLTSVILGFVYKAREYKGMKNIIAGIVMILILGFFGSFTFIVPVEKSCDHKWESVKYIVEATCFQDGVQEYKCSICGNIKNEKIEKIKHNYYDWYCLYCYEKNPSYSRNVSEGLDYEITSDKQAYQVIGIGECTDKYLTIPKTYRGLPIVKIADFAFSNNNELTGIELSDNIGEIGSFAFAKCKNLTTVKLGKNIKNIGYSAFLSCGKMENVVFPEGLENIGDFAFNACQTIKKVEIPESTQFIGIGAFGFCTELLTVKLPDNLTKINHRLFTNCYSLANINIPNTIETIGIGAFENCRSLEKFKFPNNLISIGEDAFAQCSKLTKLVLPNNLEFIGTKCFYECKKLESIIIPLSVQEIGEFIFGECDNLTIYCVAENAPDTWRENWNFDEVPVVWGYEQ